MCTLKQPQSVNGISNFLTLIEKPLKRLEFPLREINLTQIVVMRFDLKLHQQIQNDIFGISAHEIPLRLLMENHFNNFHMSSP